MVERVRLVYCEQSELGASTGTLEPLGLSLAEGASAPRVIGGLSSSIKAKMGGGEVKVFDGIIKCLNRDGNEADVTAISEGGGEEEFCCEGSPGIYRVGGRIVAKYAEIPFDATGPMAGRLYRSIIAVYLEG
ncbi:hypothetical protein [Kitasatospora sp. NPDC088548]|uniref:hypothetical protein n=1 Tax=Kitasatospora sp. NPDC088548 TaxID=3364075 RepID=UPI003821AED3